MSEEKVEEEGEEYGLELDKTLREIRSTVENITREVMTFKENVVSEIASVKPIRNILRKRIFQKRSESDWSK
jgi:archaellum component FlaC